MFTRVASGVAGLLVGMSLTGSVANAATFVWATSFVPSFTNGGVYTHSPASADQVSVGFDRATNEFVVTDPLGVVLNNDYTSCRLESPTVARCPQLAPYVTAFLGDGDDRFIGEASLDGMQVSVSGSGGNDTITTPVSGFLSGGPGDDTLIGSPVSDRIRGDDGRDRLIGRRGGDSLGGGPGPDSLAGGRGDDFLRAVDGDRDRSIRCGGAPGDTVIFDEDLDPAPIGCRHLNEPDAWP